MSDKTLCNESRQNKCPIEHIWDISAFFRLKMQKTDVFYCVLMLFALFSCVWTSVWNSNAWECGPNVCLNLQPSLYPPSSAPAVPLSHCFVLLVSRKPFVFCDLHGVRFCILKNVPFRLREPWQPPRAEAQKIRCVNNKKSLAAQKANL